MNYEESVRSLLALGRELGAPQQARVQKFGLGNIRILSAALGNPHLAAPCAHVAGTNGKGSTAAMLEAILRSAGYRTGLYTSPHLERINERIRLGSVEISDEAFAAAWTRVQARIESLMGEGSLAAHPTFFECVTAIAFIAFEEAKRQALEGPAGALPENRRYRTGASANAPLEGFFAVYEVGLGGRLDSTTIVEPEVAVITQIDFDHENFLGHSIEEIAAEKAGIIKPGAWVVSAPQRPEARAVIASRAREVNARLIETESAWEIGEMSSREGRYSTKARFLSPPLRPKDFLEELPTAAPDGSEKRAYGTGASNAHEMVVAPALPGRFQIQNALTAATVALLLGDRGLAISDKAIADGIASARWPGRLERLCDRPIVYLDGAHNPAAAREVKNFWQENFAGRRIVLVYGAMRDKAVDEIAGLLFPAAERVILTQPRQSRAISAQLLAEMTSGLAPSARTIADPVEAFEQALASASADDVIFVTGSLFLVGDLRRHWRERHAARAS